MKYCVLKLSAYFICECMACMALFLASDMNNSVTCCRINYHNKLAAIYNFISFFLYTQYMLNDFIAYRDIYKTKF